MTRASPSLFDKVYLVGQVFAPWSHEDLAVLAEDDARSYIVLELKKRTRGAYMPVAILLFIAGCIVLACLPVPRLVVMVSIAAWLFLLLIPYDLLSTRPAILHLFNSGNVRLLSGDVSLQALDKAKQKVATAGLLASFLKTTREQTPAYLVIADLDPRLSLAGLRIEVEDRLRKLVANLDPNNSGLEEILQKLRANEVITNDQYLALTELRRVLNQATHGLPVDPRASHWVREVGPLLVSRLDDLVKERRPGVS